MRFSKGIMWMLVAVSFLSVFFIASTAWASNTGNAQEPETKPTIYINQETLFLPDFGAQHEGLVPGEGGYKVFRPGAFALMYFRPVTDRSRLAGTGLYRRAATDAFTYNCGSIWGCGGADHDSQSDLFEQEIWVDGCLKYRGNPTWQVCDDDHTSGFIAHADTSLPGCFLCSFEAKSWHHFHTPGYRDWNPVTGDTAP